MSITKLIIAGGREFNDKSLLIREVDLFSKDFPINSADDLEIVSGMARGADMLGYSIAKAAGLKTKEFPAHWDVYGKSAGYKRNAEMADYANALIAFWDGKSKGTKHMIDLATSKGLTVKVIKY